MVPVTILISIKDEAANLPRCLASVRWADEIVVVDSASTDGSQKIAEEHGAKVVLSVDSSLSNLRLRAPALKKNRIAVDGGSIHLPDDDAPCPD